MKITDLTDRMFEVMKQTLKKNFFITKKVDPENFFKTMVETMTSSIQSSQLSTLGKGGAKPKQYDQVIQKAKLPESDDLVISEVVQKVETQTFKAKCTIANSPDLPSGISRQYWKELHKQYREVKIDTEIEIETIPFDQGNVSYVFRIKDKTRKRILAGKIDK